MSSKPEAAEIDIRVTPRSSQNKIELDPSGSIKVWVTAPPTDGQANVAVCELVAKKIGVAKSCVVLVRGDTSRNKRIRVEGVSREQAMEALSS